MNATIRFLPNAISPLSVEEPSASTSPALTFWPVFTRGLWWISVPWLERMNFCSSYSSVLPPEPCTTISSASTYSTVPVSLVRRTSPVSRAARRSMPVPAGLRAAQDLGALELSRLRVHRRVCLGDQELLFLGGVEPFDLLGHHAVLDDAVGSRDETVLGHLGERGQRADQADVRSLGRLDRAHAPVVGGVHVSHLDGRALAREPTGAQRGETAAVREPREGIGLVH